MHSHFVSSMNRPVKAKKSTDQGAEGNEVANFIHRLVDEDYKDSFKIGMDPVHKTETEDVNSLIVKCINDCNVPEWHKEAAIMYFGLSENGGLQDATYENIGEKYGVTRERIRQILSKVLVSARFRLEKIPDLASQIEERKKNALQVKRSGISKVYARLAQPSKKKLKKEDLKHRAIITGFSNFYCERYQQTVKAVAKAKERDIPLGSANGAPLPLSALREAMHRRSAVQYVARMHPVEMKKEREVEGESTTLAKAMERDDGDIKIENITDIKEDFAEENINAIDNAVARIEQEEMSGYGVGTFEDDGDADYEVEEVA